VTRAILVLLAELVLWAPRVSREIPVHREIRALSVPLVPQESVA